MASSGRELSLVAWELQRLLSLLVLIGACKGGAFGGGRVFGKFPSPGGLGAKSYKFDQRSLAWGCRGTLSEVLVWSAIGLPSWSTHCRLGLSVVVECVGGRVLVRVSLSLAGGGDCPFGWGGCG